MKLSPPVSSSDLEIAREIARRLNRHRRRDDHMAPSWSADEAPAPAKRLTPPPLPTRPAAPRPEAAEPPVEFHRPEPPPRPEPPARAEPSHHEPVAPHEPAPRHEPATRRPEPMRVEPPPRPAPAPVLEPEPEPEPTFDIPATPAFERASWSPSDVAAELDAGDAPMAEPEVEVEIPRAEPEEEEPLGALAASQPARQPSLDVDVDDDDALSPEQLVGGEAGDASPFDGLTDSEPSPFDDALLDEPAAAEEPAGPSWDEIVESCRNLAQASGAMLVDPAGQVFSARGDWPNPGPSAIAAKLVAMMEKTLKDAPTRSISAPLMGMQLTAWRVPLHEGLVTVVFVGRVPVKADARPAIDSEIHRGTGA